MKQMLAPQAPVVEEMRFDELAQGFFRRMRGQGEVFFGSNRGSGRGPTYWFEVLEDGSVVRRGCQGISIYPSEIIYTINPSDLGIKEFKWEDESRPREGG
jgi:hypothetical protein